MNKYSSYTFLVMFLHLAFGAPGQGVNPFDVVHDRNAPEPVVEHVIEPPPVDTAQVIEEKGIPEESIDATPPPPSTPDPAPLAGFDNIFDVDHIPLAVEDLPKKHIPAPTVEKPEEEKKEEIRDSDRPPKTSSRPFTVEREEPVSPILTGPRRNLAFIILLITLLILTIVINIKRKTFLNLYRSIFNDNYLNLVQREENNGNSIFFLLLYVAFFLNVALFLLLSFADRGLSHIPFGTILLGIFGLYMIRHLSMRIMGAIFPFQKAALQFNFTIIVFNCIVGMILFPLNALYAYSPFSKYMFFMGISVIIFFYFIRQLRGFFLAMRIQGLNLFHFFIYLCTCEFAPFLIIYKFISDYNSAI